MNSEQVGELARNIKSELRETHISWVLLTKDFAYKIKKPLKTSFLDFTTLSKRKFFCRQEVNLNSVIVPEIYLDVVPVYKTTKGFTVGRGKGKVFDYAVKMKKMRPEKQMDYMLEKNLVTEYHIKKIAKALAEFHKNTAAIKTNKSIEKIQEQFDDIRLYRNVVRDRLGVEAENNMSDTIGRVHEFLKKHKESFKARVKNGFIRDCHGDLHSGNIFLYRKPLIFDRIEFSDQFRYIDVLNEIAFFCMDLEAYKKNKLSKKFLEYYIDFSEFEFGQEEKKIFNYYKCYTANVRAKVNLIRGENKNMPVAKKYLNLMNSYAKIL